MESPAGQVTAEKEARHPVSRRAEVAVLFPDFLGGRLLSELNASFLCEPLNGSSIDV